jgi:hypothetical protein
MRIPVRGPRRRAQQRVTLPRDGPPAALRSRVPYAAWRDERKREAGMPGPLRDSRSGDRARRPVRREAARRLRSRRIKIEPPEGDPPDTARSRRRAHLEKSGSSAPGTRTRSIARSIDGDWHRAAPAADADIVIEDFCPGSGEWAGADVSQGPPRLRDDLDHGARPALSRLPRLGTYPPGHGWIVRTTATSRCTRSSGQHGTTTPAAPPHAPMLARSCTEMAGG